MAKRHVNGANLEVVEQGNGDPVVFVHGSASDYRTWRSQLEDFSDQYRAIAYSRRYHWPNERIPENVDYSMDEHVEDLRELLGSLEAGAAHLVGHSYGAFVALLVAIRDPQRVRTLVLAEPPVITLFMSNRPTPGKILRSLFIRPRTTVAIMRFGSTGIGPATAAARRGNLPEAMRIFGTAVLGAPYHAALSASRREQVSANSILAEFLGSGLAPLKERDVRALQVPTLLVGGQHSPGLFHRLLDRLEELLPDTRRVQIGGASHLMHEDSVLAYNAAVRSFLGTHRKPPGPRPASGCV